MRNSKVDNWWVVTDAEEQAAEMGAASEVRDKAVEKAIRKLRLAGGENKEITAVNLVSRGVNDPRGLLGSDPRVEMTLTVDDEGYKTYLFKLKKT